MSCRRRGTNQAGVADALSKAEALPAVSSIRLVRHKFCQTTSFLFIFWVQEIL
jgi:hypothetical protein